MIFRSLKPESYVLPQLVRELKKNKFVPWLYALLVKNLPDFGVSTIGSKTVVGDIHKTQWEKLEIKKRSQSTQAIEEYGLLWDEIEEAYCENDHFESFVELYVEQGNQLNHNPCDIGIVHGISTPVRLKVTAYGNANHTGTTLMNERKDALVVISPLINMIHEEAKRLITL